MAQREVGDTAAAAQVFRVERGRGQVELASKAPRALTQPKLDEVELADVCGKGEAVGFCLQVDAAIGGKTGVDFGGLKNSVGLFRMPEAVVADPAFLATLPAREVRSGMAEMYKHALIADAAHWVELKSGGGADLLARPDRDALIARSQRIKEAVVEADPEERGLREALNFGHSVGHAIESVLLASAAPALHGEAVAAGMICEAYLSEESTGLSAEAVRDIEHVLTAVYGRLSLRADQLASLLALVANDKKNRGGATRMSLLSAIGETELGVEVSGEAVVRAVERYLSL